MNNYLLIVVPIKPQPPPLTQIASDSLIEMHLRCHPSKKI